VQIRTPPPDIAGPAAAAADRGPDLAARSGAAPAPAPERHDQSIATPGSGPGSGSPARVPAVITHVAAMCRSKQGKGVTADVQAPAPGRYQVTVRRGRKELVLLFAWRHRRWDLADVQLTEGGEPQDAALSIREIARLLSDHEIGTGDPSRIRGSRLPRDSALDTKKNTVLRV
jgi:hypothetical protein